MVKIGKSLNKKQSITKIEKNIGEYMTICISAICEKGKKIIMASDCMITGGGISIEFEHKIPKIIPISKNCIVATSGNALAHTELIDSTKDSVNQLKSPQIVNIVDNIKICYQDARMRMIKERILIPSGFESIDKFHSLHPRLHPDIVMRTQHNIDTYDFGLTIIVSGVDNTGAHIHSVYNPGTSVCFDAIGYQAIGSGSPHAITTFISYDYNQLLSLYDALSIVYCAKKVSEKAPGVGSNLTNLCIVDGKGVIFISHEHIQELDDLYIESEKERVEIKTISGLDKLLPKIEREDRIK